MSVVELAKPTGASLRSGALTFLARAARTRPSVRIGLVILVGFGILAVLAPVIEPFNPSHQVGPVFGSPSGSHPLGLDDGGSDMLSLVIQGARVSMLVGCAATLVAIVIGGAVGLAAGYVGGATDTVLMRITDLFLVLPDVALMIVIAAIWGASLFHIIIVIGILLWTFTARVVRAEVKSVRERPYVRRARALGVSHPRVVLRHVLPHIAPLVIANVVLTIAVAIFDETALAFLGLGDPTAVSWGTLIEHAAERSAVSVGAWWAIVPPGVCVAIVISGCYLLGQGIEEMVNPRLRVTHLARRSFTIGRPDDA